MKRLILALLLCVAGLWAAIPATAQWEVRIGGADTNGGGFVYGIGAKDVTAAADLTMDATVNTRMASATHACVVGDAYKWINVTAGTNWRAGWYQVLSCTGNSFDVHVSPSAAGNANLGTYDLYGAVDYSMQLPAQVSPTDLASVAASAVITSVSKPFTALMPGNIIQITNTGTGAHCVLGFYEITVYTDDSTVTVDRAIDDGTACVAGQGSIGGALLTPGKGGGAHVGSNTIWLKYNATSFKATSTSSNVTNGKVTLATGTVDAPTIMRGYEVTRGDETSNRPTFAWGVNGGANSLITSAGYLRLSNFVLDGVRVTYTGRGISFTTGATLILYKLKLMNFAGVCTGITTQTITFDQCELTGNAVQSLSATTGTARFLNSYLHDNPYNVIEITTGNLVLIGNIFSTNKSGASYSAAVMSGTGTLIAANNTIYNSGSHGIDLQAAATAYLANNHLEANGGYGLNVGAMSPMVQMVSSSGYGNGSGDYTTANLPVRNVVDFKALTASPLVNPAGGDFSLTTTAAGLQLRGAGVPQTFPGGTTISRRDIGAAQHLDTGGARRLVIVQ